MTSGFKFKFIRKRQESATDKQQIEPTFAKTVEEEIITLLRKRYLVEMLAAEKNEINPDEVEYKFQLHKEEAELFKEIVMQNYTRTTGFNTQN